MPQIEEKINQEQFMNHAHKIRVNLLHTSCWLKDEIAVFLKPFGITRPQFNILRILRGIYPDTMSTLQIRERMIEKMSDTSRMVDRLVKKGWVDKKPCTEDKRLVNVRITEMGLNLLQKIDPKIADLDKVTDNLTEEEAILLNHLLNKLRQDD